MKRLLWKLVRALEICMFAAMLLFVTGCLDECGDQQAPFKWRGKVWKFWFTKGDNRTPVSVVGPDGKTYDIKDPRLPFQVQVKDDGVHVCCQKGGAPSSPGGGSASPRAVGAPAGSPPLYVYLLSDAPQDAVYILDQQTSAVVGVVPLPTLPQGIAVSNSGDHAYVTNQGIEAGNPFFPQAPPRVRVIDKATRAVSGMIDLTNGTQPGKPVVSPDDRFVYVPVRPDRRISATTVAGVAIIDAQSRTVVGTVPVSVADWSLTKAAITPDGALLFAVATQTFPARVFVIDTFTREQSATFIVANSSFRDLLVDHTGSRLYLLNQDSVEVYNTATLTQIVRVNFRASARFTNMALSIDGRSLFINDQFSTTVFRMDTGTYRAEEIGFPGETAPEISRLLVIP
jgi:DNA-binding beta-propeller fold protein YncE